MDKGQEHVFLKDVFSSFHKANFIFENTCTYIRTVQYECIQTSFLSEEIDADGFSKSNFVFSLYSYIYWSLWCCEDGVVVK